MRGAAHGGRHATEIGGVDLTLGLSVVAGLGVLGGWLAARTWSLPFNVDFSHPFDKRAIDGLLLACFGAAVAVSTLLEQPAVGLSGVTVGLIVGLLVAVQGGSPGYVGVVVSSIVLYQFVEGVFFADIRIVNSPGGLLGVLALSGFTVAGCVVVGGLAGLSRVRAIAAVVLCGLVFALGAILGTVDIVDIATIPRPLIAATVGGTLVATGIGKIERLSWSRYVSKRW